MSTPSSDPGRAGTAYAPARGEASGPAGSMPARPRRGARLPVVAVVAAAWAGILSYVPILALTAVGAIGSSGTPAGVARFAGAGWLLAHGVPLQTPSDRVSLVPLALSALVVWRLIRAGVHASRGIGGDRSRSIGRPVTAALAVAAVHAGFGAGAAALVRTEGLAVDPVRAAIVTGVLAAAAASAGAVAGSRAGRVLGRRMPRVLVTTARASASAAALLIAGGAAAAGVALALRGGDAADMLGSYRAGVLGQAGVTLLCVAYIPNVSVWAAAYLLGPGFAVGADTVVSPAEVVLGPVPGLPVLAGLPSAPLAGAGPLLLGIPLLAGVGAGLLASWPGRGAAGRHGWAGLVASAALAGPAAGALIQLAAAASAGSLGSGRLGALGPTDWLVGGLATVVVGLGVLVGQSATHVLVRHDAADAG